MIIHHLSHSSCHTSCYRCFNSFRIHWATQIIGSTLVPLGFQHSLDSIVRRHSASGNHTIAAYGLLITLQHSLQTIWNIILIKDTIVTISKHSWCTIVGTHNNKRVIGIKHKYASAIAIGNTCYGTGQLSTSSTGNLRHFTTQKITCDSTGRLLVNRCSHRQQETE